MCDKVFWESVVSSFMHSKAYVASTNTHQNMHVHGSIFFLKF